MTKLTVAGNWKFESAPLQRRVCELSVPQPATFSGARVRRLQRYSRSRCRVEQIGSSRGEQNAGAALFDKSPSTRSLRQTPTCGPCPVSGWAGRPAPGRRFSSASRSNRKKRGGLDRVTRVHLRLPGRRCRHTVSAGNARRTPSSLFFPPDMWHLLGARRPSKG